MRSMLWKWFFSLYIIVHCFPSLVYFHFSFFWNSVTLCCSLSALWRIHCCSSFLHVGDDSLVFESCAFFFFPMICSVVSLLLPGLSLFFLLFLLHPGSPPTLTYVSASDVIIYNCTMHIMIINSSPTFLITPVIHLNAPVLHFSPSHFIPSSSWQDFLGQVHCTLGEIVGSPASRLEKPLMWVSKFWNFQFFQWNWKLNSCILAEIRLWRICPPPCTQKLYITVQD